MAATSTFKQVLDRLVEDNGIGRSVAVDAASTTTTITVNDDGVPDLRGPFSSTTIPVGSPVLITAETSGSALIGFSSFVQGWNTSTGVLTFTPALPAGTDATGAIIVTEKGIDHADRLKEAVNRALTMRVWRRQLTPLTFVPDGDLQGTTVTDYWTAAANGTAAYVSAQVYPAGTAADAFGQTGLNRLVQLTTSGGSSTLTGNGIRVPVSNQQHAWYFHTAIRLVSGSGTLTFSIRDNTNSADISLQVTRGNDSQTLTTTTLGDFMVCEGTFQLPATCAEIAPQLTLSATGLVAQMGPVIMFPQQAVNFPLPNRIESDDDIGNFYYARPYSSPSSYATLGHSGPFDGGIEHMIRDYGDHRTVSFNFRPCRPIWFEEVMYHSPLSAMTDTTTAPIDWVVMAAWYELADWMHTRERPVRNNDGRIMPSAILPIRNKALRRLQRSGFEPAAIQVAGRR
jgi:hypothetical protein